MSRFPFKIQGSSASLRQIICAAFFGISAIAYAGATPAPETHVFKVKSVVNYRCYGGYDPKKVVKDTTTGFTCDNKDYRKTLFEKDVSIKIKFEPNPDNEQFLAGHWTDQTEFMGRKFSVTILLLKENLSGTPTYRARFVVDDSDPTARLTTVSLKGASPGQLSPIALEHISKGTPQEITYLVEITPALAPGTSSQQVKTPVKVER
jgi:hypothetical protein